MWKIVFPIFAFFAVGLCIPGGIQNADINDQDFINALSFAVAIHNSRIPIGLSLRQVVEIVSAQVQVVEGAKYVIVVTLGRTNCVSGQPNTGCTVYPDPAEAQIYQCTFTVWSRPWLNSMQLLGEKCEKL